MAVTHRSACGTNSGALTLSESSLVIGRNEISYVTASNCTGLFGISQDTDVVRTAVNGNRISLYPTNVGEVTVDVCDGTGVCLPLIVKVVDNR